MIVHDDVLCVLQFCRRFHLIVFVVSIRNVVVVVLQGLRVGIHSGPVTAGVLRGAKSRFQLFGGECEKVDEFVSAFNRESIN